MAETSVKNRVCNACGSEVRGGALFCYNCGGSVAPETVAAPEDKKQIAEKTNGDNPAQAKQTIAADAADKPIPKPVLVEEPKLKSAATMRRKSKSYQPKRIEVIWEEHENAPNVWFILAAIVLTLGAVAVLYLAMQLK